jgi:hypothetical protein
MITDGTCLLYKLWDVLLQANKCYYLYKCFQQLQFLVHLIVINRAAIGLHAILNSLLHTKTIKR